MGNEFTGMYSECDMISETSMQVLSGSRIREIGILRKCNIRSEHVSGALT